MKKLLVAGLAGILLMVGCTTGKGEQPVFADVSELPLASAPPSPLPATPTPQPTEDLTGKALNILSGYYIDEAIARRRPVAVVINNIRKSLPQSGISQADLYYEVLAEGDITRIIAIFQDFDSQKIGTVRSARDYFLMFAADHDALFVHFGGSTKAYSDIAALGVNNMDGMRDDGYWRDPVRFSQPGMYEHSAYTSAEKIWAQMEKKGYRLEKAEDDTGMFNFYDTFTVPLAQQSGTVIAPPGQRHHSVTIPYAPGKQAAFTYDAEQRNYLRYQFGEPHIDEETGQQLRVDNVLIQLTDMYVISGDDAGRRDVTLVGGGNGVLLTGGAAVPVTWQKASYASPTQWFDQSGKKLTLNKGKTWICVLDKNTEPTYDDFE